MHELKRVRWRDAFFVLDETDQEDCIVETVGWVLQDGPTYITLAGEKLPDGWRAITHVPAVLVQDVTTLGVTR